MRDVPDRFDGWVRAGLDALRAELPWGYAAMCEALGAREVLITVSGQPAAVRCDGARATVSAEVARPAVTLRATAAEVVALADGERTIAEAVIDGRVVMRGEVDDLLAAHDALVAFVRGAVRAPSFAWRLDAFRQWAAARDAARGER
ncbi:MAG: hypothetical protein R3A52_08895 [Polyangiales bacterium]